MNRNNEHAIEAMGFAQQKLVQSKFSTARSLDVKAKGMKMTLMTFHEPIIISHMFTN